MTLYIIIVFVQGMIDEVLRHYSFDKRMMLNRPIKGRMMPWAIYLTGTFFIFSLPFTWILLVPNAPQWSIFYMPLWFVAVLVGTSICRKLLKEPH
jgi:L-asparagine transporter-like permease